MSFRWWGKYSQKVLGKWKPFQQQHYRYYPVPGCIGHCEVIGDRRGEILFKRYVDRPRTAHALYWRTHPAEYKAFMEFINKK